MAITCFFIPAGLILTGILTEIGIKDSLSHYYYAEYPPKILRVIFVGLLVLLGGLLFAYRGFDNWDNWIHNFAGFFSLGVAIFPMQCPYTIDDKPFIDLCFTLGPDWLHYTSAGLLFFLSIISIMYNGGWRLKQACKTYIPGMIRSFIIVRIISGIIVSFGVAFALVMLGIGGKELLGKLLWIPESLGFFGFCLYWGFYTFYVYSINKEHNKRKEEEETQGMKKRTKSISGIDKELSHVPTRAIP
jgi:hypothetical protein